MRYRFGTALTIVLLLLLSGVADAFGEKAGISSDAYDVARDTLAENSKSHRRILAEYDEQVLSIEKDRAYRGKKDRSRLSHLALYRHLGRDDLYRSAKRRGRYKMLLGLLAGGLIAGSMVTAIVKSWQITVLEDQKNNPFHPDPPEHVPARKPYWIAAAALTGVGILGTVALTFYRTDKTTSVQRADMVREYNEALKKRLDLASSQSPSTAKAVRCRIALAPMIHEYGGGVALGIQY